MNRRVAMVVRNAIAGDSRVRKSAAALAASGWDVTIIGTSPDAEEHRLELDGVPAVLVPVARSLTAATDPLAAGRLAARDAALRGSSRLARPMPWPAGRGRRVARSAVGALTPGGGWRRLDPWVQEVELALAPHVEALEPAVIHAHDHHTVPLGARSSAVLRARGLDTVWVHDAHELSAATADRGARGLRGLLRRRMITGMLAELVPTAAAVVTVSDELADRLHADLRLPARPVVVLNAPVVAGARPAPSLRARAGVAADTKLLVYAGGLAGSRGVDLAVRALALLPGVHLALVAPDGDPQARVLCELADALGVRGRVHVVPYVAPDQVVDHVRAADAGLVPLRHRPNHELSLVTKYLEYVQARLPLVVSDVRAMAAFTRAHGLGEVFRAGAAAEEDAAALAGAAARVLADPQRYRAGYEAAAGTLARLTWEAQASVLTGLYLRLAQASPRSGPPRQGRRRGSLR